MRFIRGKIEIRVSRIPRPFPPEVWAFTVFPFIVYEAQVWDDPCVQAHERYHWKDQARWLVVPWFIAYFIIRTFRGGGREHPMEREAYRIEDGCRQP